MELKRKPSLFWSRLHFLMRFLGLTGLMVAGVGAILALANTALQWAQLEETWHAWVQALRGEALDTTDPRFVYLSLVLGGLLTAVVALVVEQVVILRMAAGRRSTVWLNSALQGLLATALLVGVNAWSYQHYTRFDWTRQRQFTLPDDVQQKLRRLQGETDIIVYLPHQSFGQSHETLKPKDRRYIAAADRKVVEKLRDLVAQFREFGPQFRVTVLDVNDENFDTHLKQVTQNRPQLREAIEQSPENTIFFTAQDQVQRLGFHELLVLDKETSFEKDNLVLLNQGVESLVHKILTLDARKPRIGIAVVHELLTSLGDEDAPYTMAGLRRALTSRGFEVKDIILKRWNDFGPPEPAVYTYDENRLDRLEESIRVLETVLASNTKGMRELADELKLLRTATLDELTKRYAKELQGRKLTEAMRRAQIEDLEEQIELGQAIVADQRERLRRLQERKNELNVDALAEQLRLQDLQAKLTRALADCDLLIVPRMTIRDVSRSSNIPNWLHHLDDAQADAIREFLKQGKPILACLGPTNDDPNRTTRFDRSGPDGLERMLTQLGVKFAQKTVLFDSESESFVMNRANPFAMFDVVDIPPVEFDWKPGAGRSERQSNGSNLPSAPHPIRQSMRLTARSLGTDTRGKNMLLDLRWRYPQPIYYEPTADSPQHYDPVFVMSGTAAWDEEQPFPTLERVPQPPKKRQSPYPLGVAFETKLPAAWYADKDAPRATVRAVVIGHGSLFNGARLNPGTETLLLDTIRWLLGRDQELTLSEAVWTYPRVALSEPATLLWQSAALLGLPGLFAYLGLVVVLLRRTR